MRTEYLSINRVISIRLSNISFEWYKLTKLNSLNYLHSYGIYYGSIKHFYKLVCILGLPKLSSPVYWPMCAGNYQGKYPKEKKGHNSSISISIYWTAKCISCKSCLVFFNFCRSIIRYTLQSFKITYRNLFSTVWYWWIMSWYTFFFLNGLHPVSQGHG